MLRQQINLGVIIYY